MATIRLRFYGRLNDFLPAHRRQLSFTHETTSRTSIKDVIESLGVPHPEVGLLLANSQSVAFTYLVQDTDTCSVYPAFDTLDVSAISLVQPEPLTAFRFILDQHLGKLATYLRMLGFDARYRNDYHDQELAQVSGQEMRILLTRDRGLLMRSQVVYGYYVRQTQPRRQLSEIVERFGLSNQITPFRRCLVCNGLLTPVAKEAILDQLPPHVRENQQVFFQCTSCDRIYWEGSHFQRMNAFIHTLLPA